MKILTIAEWFIDKHGIAKPKRVMTFGNCLFKLRDVKIKQQLLCSACSAYDLQIYWFVTQRAINCSNNAKNKLC